MRLEFRKRLLTLVGVVFLAACGSGPKTETRPVATVSAVTVETARFEETPETYEAVGTVISATSSVLGAQIGGTIREIRVKPGDRVKRGQVLAILDDRSPRAQLSAAEAGVEESSQALAEVSQGLQATAAQRKLAETTYHRYQDLLAKNSLSRQEFDEVEARYHAAVANEAALEAKKKQVEARQRQARAGEDSANTLLSYATIVSPIDGIVTSKPVDAGTVIMPGMPVLTVEDPGHYRLEASLPEDLLPKVHLGETVPVSTTHGRVDGRVEEIIPSADASTRTVIVKVALPADCGCRSGEYGKAGFPLGSERRLTVPLSALVQQGELEGLFVVDAQGAVQYRLVKSGKSLGERVEILSGLSEGDRVATSRIGQLRDGARVEVP